LSDIASQDNQIKIGKLLAADYLVLGEIIDMANTLLITVRLVDTASGEIIWQDKLTEKLKTYDYIGSYFARLILEQFGAQAEESTLEKIAVKKKE
jgi:TolB-like protein